MIHGKHYKTGDKSDLFRILTSENLQEKPQVSLKNSPVKIDVKLKTQMRSSTKARTKLLRETLKIEEQNKLDRIRQKIRIINYSCGEGQDYKFKRPLKPKSHLAKEAKSKVSPIKRASSAGRLIRKNPSENTLKAIDEKYESILLESKIDEQKIRKLMRNKGLLTSAGTINQKFFERYVNIIQEGYNYTNRMSGISKRAASTCPPSLLSGSMPVITKFPI